MMTQRLNRTCRLKRFEFPKYWEEIVESVESADQVVDRMKELHAAYQSDEGEGISFALEDGEGNALHIGCSADGWVVMSDPKDGFGGIAVGDKRARGHKPFLFPEWTDFERKHLIPSEVAVDIVKHWVETGHLGDAVEWMT